MGQFAVVYWAAQLLSGGETGGDSVFDRQVPLICTEEYDLHLKN